MVVLMAMSCRHVLPSGAVLSVVDDVEMLMLVENSLVVVHGHQSDLLARDFNGLVGR